MGKMYYTEEEAAERLGIGADELAAQVRDGKLRVFQDGTKKMFRVDEVDALAGPGEEEAIPLSAAETGDAISLGEAETVEQAPKEDTVITAEGISIFDDEDLEIEAADPMAKTQIAPGIEDQISLEGVGSGSGLLDLTRESDDTSLGAEVLDHIDIEEGAPAAVAQPMPAAPATAAIPAGPIEPVLAGPVPVEAVDAIGGLFGGIIIGCAIVAGLLGTAAIGVISRPTPAYLATLKAQMPLVVGAGLVVILVAAALGWLVGKSAVGRRQAMEQMGG